MPPKEIEISPPHVPPVEVASNIQLKYQALKASGLDLGDPQTEELVQPAHPEHGQVESRLRLYANGAIHWKNGRAAHEVHGAIYVKWKSLLAKDFDFVRGDWILEPVTDELATGDGAGRFNEFVSSSSAGGPKHAIYWRAETGAHYLEPITLAKWRGTGADNSPVGYPTAEQVRLGSTPDTALYTRFQQGGIYIREIGHEVSAVYGPILSKWNALGADTVYGWPVSSVAACSDGVGLFINLTKYATEKPSTILSHPVFGLHIVTGAILAKWRETGAEVGALGYPCSDEYASGTLRVSDFQHGSITWTASGGAQVSLNSTAAPPASKTVTMQLFLRADVVYEGIQTYRGVFPAIGILDGTITAIGVPAAVPSYQVAFFTNDDSDTPVGTVESGKQLTGESLKQLFIKSDGSQVSVLAAATLPPGPQLGLTVTWQLKS